MAISLAIYFITIFFFIVGLFIKSKTSTLNKKVSGVSVIVCVKNSENSVNNLINDLKSQIIDINHEFIIVDDNSIDKTKQSILDNIQGYPIFKFTKSYFGNKNLSYKKRALDAGIKISKYEYLLFTDADCRLNNKWVASMMKNYENNFNYIIGCSIISEPKTFSSYFQMIDYYMLMISSYASCNLGIPLACTGQNQSYEKKLYKSIDGFNSINTLIQGDDSIYLQLLRKQNRLNVTFSIDKNSFVKSKAHHYWKNLLLQRIRWAGDANIMWKYNKLFYIIIVSTFLTNLFFMVTPFLLFESLYLIITFFSIKFMLEFILYFFGIKKMYQKFNFLNFIYWFIMHPPYVVLMGILSFFSPMFGWRESS